MRTHVLLGALFCITVANAASAAQPAVELEIVTERGVQITAPREWLQLLAAAGIEHVRIRGGQAGDQPHIENTGSGQSASYHILGVLTAHDQLRLPGGTFSKFEHARLQAYFARLSADGTDAITAPRPRFGLTDKELNAALADLAQPIDFETKGQPLHAVIDQLQSKLSCKISVDADAEQLIRSAAPVADEFKGTSTGTSLAIMLRDAGLMMRPDKQLGQPVTYRVVTAGAEAVRQRTLGKMSAKDMHYWPIGWELQRTPGETAPSLMQTLNAEIDGYTLQEALAAIAPRIKMPMYFDRAVLKLHNVNPATTQVKLARTRTSYKHVIDRVLAQAHLGCEIRIDEAGMPFLWITQ
ncbi:MAG TPA: hypothetical protein VFW73_10405 [Lacipirellulaceae bacterium]|nr:hypothetical protein [Lacipirellulaceae bacterium]